MAMKSITITPISRHGFVKDTSLGSNGVVLGGLLTVCSSQATNVAAKKDRATEPTMVSPGAMTADQTDKMNAGGSAALHE
jgi:hypothetical protein